MSENHEDRTYFYTACRALADIRIARDLLDEVLTNIQALRSDLKDQQDQESNAYAREEEAA